MKKRFFFSLCLLLLLPFFSFAQSIQYSEPIRENSSDVSFDIIGKMSSNIIVFKNIRAKYYISVYASDMQLKEDVKLDFMPEKTFNVDYIAYPDHFFLIYQYQKKGVVYCMAANLDANGKKLNEPVELDTTRVGAFGDYKIYSTINSEDRQKVMVFKIQKKNQEYNLVTLLYDQQLQLIHKNRQLLNYEDRKEVLSDFLLDNEGNFIFAKSAKSGNRDNFASLSLLTMTKLADTLKERKMDLEHSFIDEVKLKVDNVNKRYLLSSFYFAERRGNIEGLFCSVWDVAGDSSYTNVFSKLDDDTRAEAKSSGPLRSTFNDFFIRNILLKKDGSYLLIAEDYSSQSSGNSWNRWDYLFNSPYRSDYDYYYYNPSYNSYYRPFSSTSGRQNIRYYYDNIAIFNITPKGNMDWKTVVHKKQFDDNDENYLSFGTMNTGGEIHLLFNDLERKDKLLLDNTVSPNGSVKRNPTLKSYEKGYQFMPRYSKQVGSKQLIIPSTYRGQVCFSKIDF